MNMKTIKADKALQYFDVEVFFPRSVAKEPRINRGSETLINWLRAKLAYMHETKGDSPWDGRIVGWEFNRRSITLQIGVTKNLDFSPQ